MYNYSYDFVIIWSLYDTRNSFGI